MGSDRFLDTLERLGSRPPKDAPALVIVSSGESVGVKAEGFASQVLLDPEWKL